MKRYNIPQNTVIGRDSHLVHLEVMGQAYRGKINPSTRLFDMLNRVFNAADIVVQGGQIGVWIYMHN